ncbi:hypothetical protein AAFF_G00362290 [Aldrovandia affinis]|uniref:Uncharacterized protein n=1 Tax=Aldrovandia affinis TaxID=143900 RepID=A0AAD7WN84_9TELE|nr:hypothetical protein AAFF_G00362290 [Aldrovandia affinis]
MKRRCLWRGSWREETNSPASWVPAKGLALAESIGLNCIQKGSMMELQTLQEALKVEIQVHQKLVAQMKQDPQLHPREET